MLVNARITNRELDICEEGTTMNIGTTGKQAIPLQDCSDARKADVLRSLRMVGADRYDLLLPETHSLPHLLAPDEQLLGAVYGKYTLDKGTHVSRGLMAITDRRILLVDKKPFFMLYNDISFDVVAGIAYGETGLGETVTLSTRMGDIRFRTFNPACASRFVQAVEDKLFNKEGEPS